MTRATRWTLLPALVLGVLVPLGLPSGARPAHADDPWEEALRFHTERTSRPTFYKRTEGREHIVYFGTTEALQILAKDYAKARNPQEEVRHTIVEMVFRRRWFDEELPFFPAWRQAENEASDAWLWYRSLLQEVRGKTPEHALAALAEMKDPFLNETAARALAAQREPAILKEVKPRLTAALGPPKIPKIPRRKRRQSRNRRAKFDQEAAVWSLRLENAARVVHAAREHSDTEEWKNAAQAVLEYWDDERISERSRKVIGRCLADSLGVGFAELSKEMWIREVLAGGSGVGAPDAAYGVSFAGIKAEGRRIVYVIDFSDSMLTPLKGGGRHRPVITGKHEKKFGDGLNWKRIRTRFDLARELLKQSISTLPEDRLFAVVWFGTQADTLKSTPHLMPVTKRLVKKVLKELDSIQFDKALFKPGADSNGKLRGETNLHGGLRRALQLTEQGKLDKEAFISLEALTLGAESIFLFSDGVPTVDDWMAVDKRDGETVVKDRESGVRTNATPNVNFPGPYGYPDRPYLLDDIERRLFFRTVEINCVGLGGADMSLLGTLAKLGFGEARQIGKDLE